MTEASDYAGRMWRIRMRFLEMQLDRHEALEELLEQVSEQADDRPLREAQDILHKIAGTAGSVGFAELGTAARDIECMIMDERDHGSIGCDTLRVRLNAFLDMSHDLCMTEQPKSA